MNRRCGPGSTASWSMKSLACLKKRQETIWIDGEGAEIPYQEQGFEIQDDLYGQIRRLEEDVQTIIKLRFFEELSLKEIAEDMSMNLNTVKAKLYRGLRSLRQQIEEGEG